MLKFKFLLQKVLVMMIPLLTHILLRLILRTIVTHFLPMECKAKSNNIQPGKEVELSTKLGDQICTKKVVLSRSECQ